APGSRRRAAGDVRERRLGGARGRMERAAIARRLRWPWANVLLPHVAKPDRAEKWLFSKLPEWEETPERPQPAQVEIAADEVEARLERLTGAGAERREGQRSYARDVGRVFSPRS